MIAKSLGSLNRRQLRRYLLLFLLALSIPTGILVYKAFDQLKWQTLYQYRGLASELVLRLDSSLQTLIERESDRPFVDYTFLNVAGDPSANFLQRSPLSAYPIEADIPGTLGYFQVDANGEMSTPLLPAPEADTASLGISAEELVQRQTLEQRLHQILSDNALIETGDLVTRRIGAHQSSGDDGDVGDSLSNIARSNRQEDSASQSGADREYDAATSMAEESASGATRSAFDRLSKTSPSQAVGERQRETELKTLEDLNLDQRYDDGVVPILEQRPSATAAPPAPQRRKEVGVLPELVSEENAQSPATEPADLRVTTFESEIDPFELSRLNSGHLVLYRKVWREGQRYIQGLLIDHEVFLGNAFHSGFGQSALSPVSDLTVAFGGSVLATYTGESSRSYLEGDREFRGTLIHQSALSEPFNNLQLLFSVNRLPVGPGGGLITWVVVLLAAVLSGGLFALYRLGVKQIDLTQQQQDFVAAVSHELKTPLTSIRMYGEMLREGWASDEKKREYYEFIHDESERLSRLINNVLQLARMNRNAMDVKVEAIPVAQMMDLLQSKITSHVERAGFAINRLRSDIEQSTRVNVDADLFVQVVINLVDNAIKFSSQATIKQVDFAASAEGDFVCFTVRDYGSGIAPDQMKKIFKLFYRSENELTRETVGTGIGLALVNQIVTAMHGRVDVVNTNPGAQFRVFLPAA